MPIIPESAQLLGLVFLFFFSFFLCMSVLAHNLGKAQNFSDSVVACRCQVCNAVIRYSKQ